MSIKIKMLPNCEKPYEKLEIYGAEKLSNAELLAIVIRTGSKEESSVDLAKKVLTINNTSENNLSFLEKMTIEELTKIKGIGKIKAIQLKAVCELSKRMSHPINKEKIVIKNANIVAKLMKNELVNEKREIIKILLLNTKNVLIKKVNVAWGMADKVEIDIKYIFEEAIKSGVPKIIVVHNHPSGDPTPSIYDYEITEKIKKVGDLLKIELLDHIIIGNGKYATAMRRKDNIYEIKDV